MSEYAEEEEHAGGMERWLLTYADMITLLLALFIVLFAMSSIDQAKFTDFRSGLIKAFASHMQQSNPGDKGLLQHNSLVTRVGAVPGVTEAATAPSPPPTTPQEAPAAIESRIAAALAAAGVSQEVQLTVTHEGVVARILSDKVFFAVDSADLGPVGSKVMDVVGSVLAALPNSVSVRGYTDNQPILGGRYRSNWELSAERAVTVVEHLVGQDGIDAARLSAAGYGESHPLVPNDTPVHQAANRRVDIVILTPGPQPGATPE